MNRFKSILKNPHLYSLLILLLLMIYLTIPQINKIKATSPGYTFSGIHGYITDYYHYLSAIEQGKSGYWLFQRPNAVEPWLGPTIVHFFYIMIGKAAYLMRISNIQAYWLFLLLTGMLFAASSYCFIKLSVPKKLVPAALFFAFFGSTFPPSLLHRFNITTHSPPPWWAEMSSPYFRVIASVHRHFAEALLVASYFFIAYYFTRRKNIAFLWAAGIINFFSILIFPLPGLSLILSLGLFLILGPFLSREIKKNFDGKTIIGFIFIIILSLAALFFLRYEISKYASTFSGSLFLASQREFQRAKTYGLFKDFIEKIIIFGPLMIFFLVGIVKVIKKPKIPTLLAAFWILTILIVLPAVLLFVGEISVRGVISGPFVAMSVVSIEGVSAICEWISRKIKILSFNGAFLFIIFFYILSIIPAILHFGAIEKPVLATNFYLPNDTLATYKYIKENVPPRSIVLTGEYVGTIMPAFAPILTPIAEYGTYDLALKKQEAEKFYSGNISVKEAKTILKKYNIAYVYWGWDESAFGGDPAKYANSLELLYSSGRVHFYKVNF